MGTGKAGSLAHRNAQRGRRRGEAEGRGGPQNAARGVGSVDVPCTQSTNHWAPSETRRPAKSHDMQAEARRWTQEGARSLKRNGRRWRWRRRVHALPFWSDARTTLLMFWRMGTETAGAHTTHTGVKHGTGNHTPQTWFSQATTHSNMTQATTHFTHTPQTWHRQPHTSNMTQATTHTSNMTQATTHTPQTRHRQPHTTHTSNMTQATTHLTQTAQATTHMHKKQGRKL